MSTIRKIIIHCSDTPGTMDIGVKEIRKWHTDPPPRGRGWTDIGYQYVIRRNGKLEAGRYEDGDSVLEGKEIGAHVKGHNSDSLAICLVGRGDYTEAQNAELTAMTLHLLRVHKPNPKCVYGHYEFDKGKTCPLMDMNAFRAVLHTLWKAEKAKTLS